MAGGFEPVCFPAIDLGPAPCELQVGLEYLIEVIASRVVDSEDPTRTVLNLLAELVKLIHSNLLSLPVYHTGVLPVKS
jgi:hypothetical protein